MSDSNDKKIEHNEETRGRPLESESRRKFTKAALLASPVLMTVASKAVWANPIRKCSVSVLMSANHSIDTDWNDCRTCSPGYWHNSKACWISAGMENNRDQPFGELFDITNVDDFSEKEQYALTMSLENILNPSTWDNDKKSVFLRFGRAATASYLNARALGHLYPTVAIPTEGEVKTLVSNVFSTLLSRADRKSAARSGKNQLETFYQEGSVDCILPKRRNTANCPASSYNIK
ncbi:MAG: hypothetical protein OQK24_10065 [Magnetovibrio sp.]|nr:hypothetical protein [Magnetovibrio sp.]